MRHLTERRSTGHEAVEAITALLQRVRAAHPTSGLYEAAEVQWWWTKPRRTDDVGQLLWYNGDGQPEAAFMMTDFGDGGSLVYGEVTVCPFFLPDASPELMAHVIDRGLAVAAEYGFPGIELEVDQADATLQALLLDRGLAVKEKAVIAQGWINADNRPDISSLPSGYRLTSRSEIDARPHHLGQRNPAFSEERLRQLSLYRPDLDLVVVHGPNDDDGGSDTTGDYAAYALFWYDPVTSTGTIEPVRTHDDHQGLGLSRHLLTSGMDRLAEAGADRISIGWEPDNPASSHLYQNLGFRPDVITDLFGGATG